MPGLNVKVEQGELRGCSYTTKEGSSYNSYCGIPYAKPPLGELRFKDPLLADSWIGVRDATKEGDVNAHVDSIIFEEFVGSEDSLFVNVHVPSDALENAKLPVMVFIHGGAFQMGSGNKEVYGPDYLVQQNVILVTFNYRLGALGFLCLHTSDVPGNAGLKDQVLALKWVKKNIENFGGDSENITIFGESAGGASVNYLMLSPLAKGLFDRAIMQSGTCMNDWSMQSKPVESAFALAKKLGLKSLDKEKVLEFLRKVPVEEICEAISESFNLSHEYNFAPVLENDYPNVNSFITKSPLDLMMSGSFNRVPCMCGFNSQEGLIFFAKYLPDDIEITPSTTLEELDIEFSTLLPKCSSLPPEKQESIKKFYFSTDKGSVDNCLDLLSDIGFICGIYQTVKLLSRTCQPTYYYLYSYHGNLNIYKYMCKYPYTGASHADELGYLFKPDIQRLQKVVQKEDNPKEIEFNKADVLTIQRIVKMWTNFAKFGNPTPEITDILPTTWKPVCGNEMNCLEIGSELKSTVNPYSDRMKFWENIMNSN